MEIIATEKREQNRAVLDPWTAVHFSMGLAAGLMSLDRRWVIPAAAAYELLEQYLERNRVGQDLFKSSGPEDTANALADVAVFAVGHWLGERWNESGR